MAGQLLLITPLQELCNYLDKGRLMEKWGSLWSRTGGRALGSEDTGGIQETSAEMRLRRAFACFLRFRWHSGSTRKEACFSRVLGD